MDKKQCIKCNNEFIPARSSAKYCSVKCARSKNGGHNKKPVTWWKNQKGYIEGRIWLPDGTQIRVKQHRWIMSGLLGRPLETWENVHHINGIKDDNRPENLELMSHSDHVREHNLNREYKKGYKLNLSDEEREARSFRAISMELSKMGNLAKAMVKS